MAEDRFEKFGRMAHNGERAKLIVPQPIEFEKKVCRLSTGDNLEPVAAIKKSYTKEELYAELDVLREKYKKFLVDKAPKLESKREKMTITHFTLDGKEQIDLPHYGEPIGYAKRSYEAEFNFDGADGKAVYFCCTGADYIATVMINGKFAGTHEGFFAPFEFEISELLHKGTNKLEIILKNDHTFMGNSVLGERDQENLTEGDKFYAATGLGFDSPDVGWHHCPAGMGIYGEVSIEIRERLHIADVFVQPKLDDEMAVVWIEVENVDYKALPVKFDISVYGQNFDEVVREHEIVEPKMGKAELPAKHGKNVYKIPVEIPDMRLWKLDEPNLYQIQVRLIHNENVCDTAAQQFGMRSFTQDTESEIKGMYYLNGKKIRMRGANTMGFEQQDVLHGDFDQLVDDILLAKLCNMNYWRITQRPVQKEIYDYCDRLGFLTQCDFPLFGVMRRTRLAEAVKQVEEMVRLVRSHPCHTVVTYINEPWPNANSEPHRHMLRDEMEVFFEICDRVVHYNAPDCVVKHVDGDFDPPTYDSMPDLHCYTLWYNGAQLDFGMLYRGFEQEVAPGWYYGCGEYGAEAFDCVDLMRRRYPAEWLQEPLDMSRVVTAQAPELHGSFIDTPDTLEEWADATQRHQAYATRMMTESYRRDPRMVSNAIHLFIDAWPSGWMKSIMDCERTPKEAYFAYRDALEPVLVSLRSDRFTCYEGETFGVETWICNDTNKPSADGSKIVYELYRSGKMVMRAEKNVVYGDCTSEYVGTAEFELNNVNDREKCTLRAILETADGNIISDGTFDFEVFAHREIKKRDDIVLITELEKGEHDIAGEKVTVSGCPHAPKYFLSRKTGHPVISEFEPDDFKMWYDAKADRLTPISKVCFRADGFKPILICNGSIDPWIVAGEKMYDGKRYVICLADLRMENPIAERFLGALYEKL